jgi:hypothetical protein
MHFMQLSPVICLCCLASFTWCNVLELHPRCGIFHYTFFFNAEFCRVIWITYVLCISIDKHLSYFLAFRSNVAMNIPLQSFVLSVFSSLLSNFLKVELLDHIVIDGFLCSDFFGSTGVWTQSLTLARLALWHLSHSTSPVVFLFKKCPKCFPKWPHQRAGNYCPNYQDIGLSIFLPLTIKEQIMLKISALELTFY